MAGVCAGGLACAPRSAAPPAPTDGPAAGDAQPATASSDATSAGSPSSGLSSATETGAKTDLTAHGSPPAAGEDPPPSPSLGTLPDGAPIEPCLDPVPAGMACIPGGKFIRGVDEGALSRNAKPAQEVWLQTFYMDLDEATNEEYRACKEEKKCLRGGPLYNDFSRDKQPIVGVSWYAAVKYCEAHGKHLPTEAQWEKAARGPDGELFPWGNEPATCERAVIQDATGRSCGVKKLKEHPEKGRTFEIGSRPAYRYGLRDMAGNSWEWVYDWESRDWNACGKDCQGQDPTGPCDGKEPCGTKEKRVVKGGSWYWSADYATGYHRRFHYPANDPKVEFHHFGFRCAASADEAKGLLEPVSGPEAAPAAPQP
jgi:formylglycine-generating enzyme required for sulfatase activity